MDRTEIGDIIRAAMNSADQVFSARHKALNDAIDQIEAALRAARAEGIEAIIAIGLDLDRLESGHEGDEGSVMQEGASYRRAGVMNVVDRARLLLKEPADADR